MSDRRHRLATLLLDLEAQLRNQSLWIEEAPSAAQLASTMPFAVDILPFEQWLQWIFLPAMHAILEQGLPLPAACAITPAAEVSFAGYLEQRLSLLHILQGVDGVFIAEAKYL